MRHQWHAYLPKRNFFPTRLSSRLSPYLQQRPFSVSKQSNVKINQLSIPTEPPANFPKFTPDQLSNKREYFRHVASTIELRPFWGLPIFRLSYGDNGLWDSYLKTLYQETYASLRSSNQEYLAPYFFCPVISHPSLQDASHDTIRERFRGWAIDTRDPRAKQAQHVLSESGFDDNAQESACLVVDDYCLKKFAEVQLEDDEFKTHATPIVVLTRKWDVEMYRGYHRAEYNDGVTHRLIAEEHNAECEDPEDHISSEDEDHILFEEIDGFRVPVLGWMRARIGSIASLYQSLSEDCGTEAWYKAHARPPRMFPDHRDNEWKLF